MAAVIEAKDIVKKFGEVVAVDGVSFEVQEGEIFAFLGPNGAGKSTTIKMLTTLLRPTSGSLKLAGHDVSKEKSAVRQSFGIVFQDSSVDSELTAYENMELHGDMYAVPRAELKVRIERLMKLVELWERKDSQVKTFSGGMKRRLEIARGLLHEPKILFLDEPTLGLDTQTRNLLWDYVRKLNDQQGMTIFFSTHYLEEAEQIANQIAIIDHGKIVARGTSADLMRETKTNSLEEAYLALTGTELRDEGGSGNEAMKQRLRARGRG
jgi:ABC-2 type transport system ATP-binding protein